MQAVSFHRMADGTQEDYDFLENVEAEFKADLPIKILDTLAALEFGCGGYQISRLEHSLQSATRAYRDGRDEPYVVACLVHDIGDTLAPWSHGEMAASILKPFVSERIYWIVKYHPLFQYYYSGKYIGRGPNSRDRFRGHAYFDDCVEFCELYDQCCFDPGYESESLDFFAPMVHRLFGSPPTLSNP